MLAADIYGKIKTVLLDIGTAFLILASVNTVIMWIGEIVFYAGAVLTVWSGVRYLVKNKHVLADVTARNAAKESDAADGGAAEAAADGGGKEER